MNFKNTLLLIVLLAGFTVYSDGQTGQAEIERMNTERRRQQEERTIRNSMSNLDRLQNGNRTSRTVFKKEALSKEDRKVRDKLVAPDAEDVRLYEDYLKKPDRGIFRLFADNDCVVGGILKADGKCQNIFPETWFYSFRARDYSDNLFFDIFLKNGKIITDSLLSQGMLVRLGNFSLDNVTLKSPGAKFPVDFKPAEKGTDIKIQYDQIDRGFVADGFHYSKAVEAKVGGVYLLRVVAYRLQRKFSDQISNDAANRENLKFILLNQDKRADVTIAFRIIRRDVNGNLTIIWKELERKSSPEAIF